MENKMELQKTAIFSSTERGNAIIFILLAIALLAALTFAVGRMSSKTSGNLSKEQARISAEQIMRTAQTYEGAIQKIINVNRCSENEINLDNTLTSVSYDNTDAPTDGRCDIFNVAGAGLKYTAPEEKFLDSSNSAKNQYGEWVWNADQCLLGLGTGDTTCTDNSSAELLMLLPHIREEICLEINNLNGVTNPIVAGSPTPPTDDQSGAGFTGTFTTSNGILGQGTSNALENHATGCFKDQNGTWNNSFVFYHVILVR